MRRSVGSRGAATSRAAFDARVGGSFIQSAIRLPRTAPSALATSATQATTATRAIGRDFDRFGFAGDGERSDPGGSNDGVGEVAGGASNGEPAPNDDPVDAGVVGGDDGVRSRPG